MTQILLVAAGGAIGSLARYGAAMAAARLFGLAFPWGTLFVNVAGGLAMGLLTARIGPEHENMRLAVGVGMLGGFTTFSTFSLESVRLLQSQFSLGLIYVLASVCLSVGACWIGLNWPRA